MVGWHLLIDRTQSADQPSVSNVKTTPASRTESKDILYPQSDCTVIDSWRMVWYQVNPMVCYDYPMVCYDYPMVWDAWRMLRPCCRPKRSSTVRGRKEVFPWTVIGLLFLLWTVNCVLFSSWTVNWPPLIFSVIRELSSIFFVNRELESFIFHVIRDWPLFFFREPWILPIIFVNFLIFPPKSMSFIIMIRNWLLMIDICLLFSEMWRRSETISYQKLNY